MLTSVTLNWIPVLESSSPITWPFDPIVRWAPMLLVLLRIEPRRLANPIWFVFKVPEADAVATAAAAAAAASKSWGESSKPSIFPPAVLRIVPCGVVIDVGALTTGNRPAEVADVIPVRLFRRRAAAIELKATLCWGILGEREVDANRFINAWFVTQG